ncbi:MAG: LysR family transcriptional regulator [Casimicrobiaceae bacterium]
MDKLRAIEYFVCAAAEGSLTSAAHKLGVTPPAVSKLLATLERSLGARLFERSARGLALTPTGEEYLAAAQSVVETLAAADEIAGCSRTQLTGPVALAIQNVLAQHCLAAELGRFHARHPGIRLDVRDFATGRETDVEGADLRVALAFDEQPDQFVRVLARPRLVVCAAPVYWARHGVPARPRDLEQHNCLLLRAQRGTAMDHWPFERGDEQEAAVVDGWMVVSNVNRDVAVAAALAGHGLVRTLDIVLEDHLRAGRLVPVLTDWSATDAPVVRVMARPAAVRLPRVRATLEFLKETFADVERRCQKLPGARSLATAPAWTKSSRFRRASAAAEQAVRRGTSTR